MEILAEQPPAIEEHIEEEQYAHSLSTLRRLGGSALGPHVDAAEYQSARELALADFKTAVTEMLKTDKEFRQHLDIDNRREHPVIDGQACAADGTPMVEILTRGYKSSQKAAFERPELQPQTVRDACDIFIAHRGDELEPGQTLHALSMDPKNELRRYKPIYGGEFGYREGLVYWQTLTKVDHDTIVAGSYSIDMSDEAAWREHFEELGVEIPEDESPNTWIRNYFVVNMTAEEAADFAKAQRDKYYERVGATGERLSITEYVDGHSQVVENIFDTYYPELADAIYTGENNQAMRSLAGAILRTDAKDLKAETRQQLVRIANSKRFDKEAAKTMDSIIRYAAAEELRRGLQAYIATKGSSAAGAAVEADVAMFFDDFYGGDLPPEMLHQILARSVEAGVQAGRSYGGCPGQIELSILNREADGTHEHNRQEAYGGKTCPEVKNGQITRCPHCTKVVKAVVRNKGQIFCSNKDCKMVAPSLK